MINKEAIEKLLKEAKCYTAPRAEEYINQALALLKEQPPASEFTKEAIELDKMCVSEIVAKYESSYNAITVLKRKLRAACESDEWMKSATQFYENGGCPICFSTDEAGCKEGCYIGQLQARLDASEASRKELVEVITRVTGLGCLRDRDMATCKKGDMCCICQAEAAIEKAEK